jgi:signal transduction histidine kinase
VDKEAFDRPAEPPKTWFGVPSRIAGGFALAVASLGLSAGFSFAALSARANVSELAAEAAASELAVEDVEAALLSADAALAKYLEERDSPRFGRYERARSKVARDLAALEAIARGHRLEESQLARIQAAVARVLAEHSAVLALSAAGDHERAHARYAGDEGTSAVASANAALQQLGTGALRASLEASARGVRTATVSTVVFVAAEVLLLVLIVVAARIVRDEIRARERAMRVQQRLMGIVSHDLRNPLSAVLGSAWSLGRQDLPADARRAVQRTASAARRMHRLIRDVLDWSRAHAGAAIPVMPKETDLAELCSRVAEDLDRPVGERIRLACEGDARAVVDPDRMEQVVANLLSNALRYAPPNRPVRLRVIGGARDVSIAVSDDGPGIAPEVRVGLFEPFRPVAPGDARGGGGVGLGLFIVRTIAEAHGGLVRVDTSLGVGTTFVVQVPRGPVRGEAKST